MIGIVLAGGYGTRLWPVSRDRPKMLLPVGEDVVIDTILRPLERDERFDRIYVSTNERFAEPIEAHIRNEGYTKAEVSIEPISTETEKPGAIGALSDLIDREAISSDVLVIAGDHYVDFPLAGFVDRFHSVGAPTVTARMVESLHRAKSYGVMDVEDGRVVSFVEKPTSPPSRLISPACYAFPAETLTAFEEYLDSGGDPDAPGFFVAWLVERTEVFSHVIDGTIVDTGTREGYLEAVAWELDEEQYVSPSASVQRSTLENGTLILGDATVQDSDIEGSVIFPGTEIRDASVRDSVIDQDSTVEHIDIRASLVGKWTKLRGDSP